MFYLLITILKWTLLILVGLAVIVVAYLYGAPTFGGKADKATWQRIQKSPNFDGNTFVNLTPTQASTLDLGDAKKGSLPKNDNLLWQFLFPPKGKNPTKPLRTLPLNLIDEQAVNKATTLQNGQFVWLGHSTVLFQLANMTMITDPVFHRVSPLPVGGKPFAMTHTPTVSDLPYIDAVLLSHDHYDHLDHKTITQLAGKVGHFYVPLGVKAHLLRWGVASEDISEFDWYEQVSIQNADKPPIINNPIDTLANNKKILEDDRAITLTFAPTRHFSGRRLTGQRTTLWGSWAVQSPELSVYFSGDGGYSDEFKKIGERLGGFDIAFIEDGAYNERWRDVHMLPEESAQAGIDVGAKVVLPIHWGKFDLSIHHWREPVRRIKSAIDTYNQQQPVTQQVILATPRIGEVFDLDNLPSAPWWETEN